MLDKFISPFIASQFPAFYREQGPNFVAFVQAYYEWMEQQGNTIGEARSLLDNIDIDQTEQQFIQHFKNTYIQSLPESIISNKQLLVKHILDLYRTKGTQRAYELLFQILFGESIDIYVPGNYIIKPSDGVWSVPQYIEVSGNPYLSQLTGQQIYSSSGSASAIVESVYQKIINNKTVNVVYISSLVGRFKSGDLILCKNIPQLTTANAPYITGSLTSISIQQGGYGFNIGDSLNVKSGSGFGAKAHVISTVNQNGKVTFNLLNGGQGFSTGAQVTVLPTLNLTFNNFTGSFYANDIVTDSVSGATGQIATSTTSTMQLINYTTSPAFAVGSTLTGSLSGSATITDITGGGGSGASFVVGDITNQYVYNVNVDFISNNTANSMAIVVDTAATGVNTFVVTMTANTAAFTPAGIAYSTTNSVLMYVTTTSSTSVTTGETLSNSSLGVAGLYVYRSEPNLIWVTGTETNLNNLNISPGVVLISSGTSSTVLLNSVDTKKTITGNGIITSISGTGPYLVGVSFPSGGTNGYFIPTGTLINSSTAATATIQSVTRSTKWAYFNPITAQNLDVTLNSLLISNNITTGTIAYIAKVNPGSGYSSNPYVNIVEPLVAALQLSDGAGGLIGNDASVLASAINANNIVTSVQIDDAGFGYTPNETVTLQSSNTLNQTIVDGTSMIDLDGFGAGSWSNRRGYISDINYIQDSNLYQGYSYQIIAQRMISSYEKLVRELVHPSGVALFGKFRVKTEFSTNQSTFEQFVVSQNSYSTITSSFSNTIIHESAQNNYNSLNYAIFDEFGSYLLDESNNILVQYGVIL